MHTINIIASAAERRIGVVGIRRTFSDPSGTEFDLLYAGIGKNTGNLMFTEAAYSLIGGKISQIGFHFDPNVVNKGYDAVVVPAANWLSETADWDWLTERLAELRIPVTVIGLGLQSQGIDLAAVKVSASARRLVEFFGQSAPLISVRGNFTRDWIKSIGVENVVTTGCPSIYMNIFGEAASPPDGKIVFQGTRYAVTEPFLNYNSVNRRMFEFAAKFDAPMIFQSEPEEMALLTYGASVATLGSEQQSLLKRLYGLTTAAELDDFFIRNGKIFYDLRAWSEFLLQHKAVIGTRLHGSILALNSGRPALLVPHDSRTAEVASFTGIQAINGKIVRDCQTYEELASLLDENNVNRYCDIRSANQATFVRFLKDSGLAPRPERMF